MSASRDGYVQRLIHERDEAEKRLTELLQRLESADAAAGRAAGGAPRWESRPLEELAHLTCGRAKPKDTSRLRTDLQAVPVYGGKGLLGFSASALCYAPTIVIGRVGSSCGAVHFVAAEKSWITDSAVFVYAVRPEVDLRFLFRCLAAVDLGALRTGSPQPQLTLSILNPLPLPLPPLAEQREISAALDCLDGYIETHRSPHAPAERVLALLQQAGVVSRRKGA